MGKNKNLKKIRKYAALLPVINTYSHEIHQMKGSELIFSGETTMPDGTAIVPDQMYSVPMPVVMPISHERRIKKAYNKLGVIGVMQYISAVRDYNLKNN